MIQRPMDTKLKTRMAPSLALLTLANLTPKEHEVIIENENVESINFDEKVDLVAVTVTVDVMNRAIEIAKESQETLEGLSCLSSHQKMDSKRKDISMK